MIMDISERLNRAIDYIEENLDGDIEWICLLKIIATSSGFRLKKSE